MPPASAGNGGRSQQANGVRPLGVGPDLGLSLRVPTWQPNARSRVVLPARGPKEEPPACSLCAVAAGGGRDNGGVWLHGAAAWAAC